ncbi:sensor histidine kinase [Carboxylicivirga sp. RSCT41]|uniref:sensor histidine kinase n=1 Tax=Carboxylicivirga agarovorans TaxID=3417570 RepID=UPI003D34B354
MTLQAYTTILYKLFASIAFFTLLPETSYSTDIYWDESFEKLSIGNKVDLLEDASGSISYLDITSGKYDQLFKPSDKINLSLGYTDSYYWLRFTIDNQSRYMAFLELAQAGLPVADLYYQDDNNVIQHIKAGYQLNIRDKRVKHSYQVFPLPEGKRTYYVRLNTNSEPIPINLYSLEGFTLSANKQKIGYGIYLGLMLFVALNSIFLFISLRKGLYLFYSLIVLLYISYSAVVIDGFIVYFVPGVNLKFLYTTIPFIGIVLQTIYCIVFLELKKYSLKTYKVIKGLIIYFTVWMIMQFFLSFPLVQPVNTVHALISFGIMGYVGYKVYKKGNQLGRLFAFAYLIYFLLVAVQAIYINTGSPAYIGGLSYVAYATLAEAILLSFLLSRRFELEKRGIEDEKLAAQQKVVEKTMENERIINEQNIKLEQEVAKRTIELEQNNKKLREINREKEGIVNVVAHDLKSPLSTIISFTDLIKHEGSLSAKQEEYITVIDKVLCDGMNIIDDLMDSHSDDVDFNNPALEEFEIKTFINEWVKTFEQQLKRKEQRLVLSVDVVNPLMTSNKLLLSRILNNLLSNAIKFSDMKQEIHVSVKEFDSRLEFSVKDFGPGISIDDQQRMFKQFQKLSARPTAGESSNGLGLSIVKRLSRRLNARIILKSNVGEGSEFIIRFSKNMRQ